MLINTKFLGNIEIEETNVIRFENGLPGFNTLHEFVLLPVEGNEDLSYMQSVQDAGICFVMISPFLIIEDYEINISEETFENLKIEKLEDICLYSLLTITENIKDMTANLAGPIVINASNNQGTQEILNDNKYGIKYKLYREE